MCANDRHEKTSHEGELSAHESSQKTCNPIKGTGESKVSPREGEKDTPLALIVLHGLAQASGESVRKVCEIAL